jgi:phage gp45-like
MNIADIQKIIEPIHRRIMLMLGTQRVQITVLADEVLDQVERLGEYGFSSNPLQGASALVLFAGGNRGHAVIVATDDARYRAHGLNAGEVCVYNNTGSTILLKSDGSIVITPSNGTLTVNGSIAATGDIKVGSISLKSHVHGGVQSGGSNTAVPH